MNSEKNKKKKQKFCIKTCLNKLDNQHLQWCEKINEEQDLKCSNWLSGTLFERIQTLKQVIFNEKIQNTEIIPCDPISL